MAVFTTNKRFQPLNTLLQGDQGPPGPQGLEEVKEFPPDFLPPKGHKVKEKFICLFVTSALNCMKTNRYFLFFFSGRPRCSWTMWTEGCKREFYPVYKHTGRPRRKVFYLHFLPCQGGRGDMYIQATKGEQGIVGFPGVEVL